MAASATVRLMTYNVHRCVGVDGVLAPLRIARVIAAYRPDVVALQELDVGHARTGGSDQPRVLAEELQMHHHFHPAFEIDDGRYGDAVLSRYPLRLMRAGSLPAREGQSSQEPRGALWVAVECGGRTLQVINTHLGLGGRERVAQAEALLGPDWLGHPDCTGPAILCGDLNTWPGSAPYRLFRRHLHDAQERTGYGWPRSTFPARCPLLRIDHVFLRGGPAVRRVQVPRTRLTRLASDHLPLIVEVSLP
jgi:endonuclease/exonuclease/phosphatase family metal-dependent hydrolase